MSGLVALNAQDRAELAQLETVIEQGLQTFHATGTALATIRNARLYRATHGTFEDYCEDRWNLKRRSAYRLIEAAGVIENVSNWTQTLPANEAQARPLATISAIDQPKVWLEAVGTAPEGRVTAAHVARTVERFQRPTAVPASDDRPALPQVEFREAASSQAIAPDAVIAPPTPLRPPAESPTGIALSPNDEYLTTGWHRAFMDTLHRLHQAKEAAKLLVRHVSPEEMAAVLSEYDLEEEGRLMPTVEYLRAVFAARREAQGIRRVK